MQIHIVVKSSTWFLKIFSLWCKCHLCALCRHIIMKIIIIGILFCLGQRSDKLAAYNIVYLLFAVQVFSLNFHSLYEAQKICSVFAASIPCSISNCVLVISYRFVVNMIFSPLLFDWHFSYGFLGARKMIAVCIELNENFVFHFIIECSKNKIISLFFSKPTQKTTFSHQMNTLILIILLSHANERNLIYVW